MIESKLYIIVYNEHNEEAEWFHTVGVDMDEATAKMLVVEQLKRTYDEKYWNDLTAKDFDLQNVWFHEVIVDGWDIHVTEQEE